MVKQDIKSEIKLENEIKHYKRLEIKFRKKVNELEKKLKLKQQ
jgi:hypothetical protein